MNLLYRTYQNEGDGAEVHILIHTKIHNLLLHFFLLLFRNKIANFQKKTVFSSELEKRVKRDESHDCGFFESYIYIYIYLICLLCLSDLLNSGPPLRFSLDPDPSSSSTKYKPESTNSSLK